MTASWPELTIAECAAKEPYATQIGPFGKALRANEYVTQGVPVLRGVNVNSGRFHDDDYVYISEEKANELVKFESHPGDVLLVHKGTLGPIGLMPSRRNYERYIMGNSMLRVKCNPEVLLPKFLYYWLSSPWGQNYIFSRVSQVGVPQLQTPLKTLREARLRVPPIPEQQAITGILSFLDDKIELNRRMSETLHQIAESTFKDMFLSSAIGASEVSELAESTIGDEIDVTMGQSPPGNTYNTEGQGLPFYQGRTDFGMLFPTRRVYCTAPTRLAREGDTLLSVRAPVGDVNVAVEDCAIGRGVAALRHRSGSRVFTYFLARSLHATFDQFNGEGTVFGSISKKALLGLACPKPSDSQLHAFEKIGGPILLHLRSAMQESDTLISVRDALLPKLISGELRVPQAEQLVSEVV